jgi:hypothetical protein
MAKRVYFSFHYEDVEMFRANVVRNHWLTKEDREDAGFYDASIWESAQKKGDQALKKLINDGLEDTTVTTVLIGSETHARRWVRYEIIRSMWRGNRLFGVHINGIRDKARQVKPLGVNPFLYLGAQYNYDGTELTPYEWNGTQWVVYADFSKYELKTQQPQEKWDKFYQLSKWYTVYDWVANNGYENFSNWTG